VKRGEGEREGGREGRRGSSHAFCLGNLGSPEAVVPPPKASSLNKDQKIRCYVSWRHICRISCT